MASLLPNRIGNCLFCATCGDLLDITEDEDLVCMRCGARESAKTIEGKETITRSNPAHFPSSLRQKRSLVQAAPEDEEGDGAAQKRATINEPCPKCKTEEVLFHTMQLRSADEGSTVFYDCPNCGYTWSTNN